MYVTTVLINNVIAHTQLHACANEALYYISDEALNVNNFNDSDDFCTSSTATVQTSSQQLTLDSSALAHFDAVQQQMQSASYSAQCYVTNATLVAVTVLATA